MSAEASAATPSSTRIGWIGTGVMGSSMCGHLVAAGYTMTVYSRTKDRAEALLAAGAGWVSTPADVARASDVVFTMVGVPADVREVVLGSDGILSSCQPGTILVDMTTSEPALAREIYAAATGVGASSLDAPVSGGDVGARQRTLSIMVGGDRVAFDRARPLFDLLGKNVIFHGPAGSGQNVKMVNQIAIASGMIGLCEALLYAFRAGLDLEAVLGSISGGAAGSWSLSNYGPRILCGDFAPGFSVAHFIKDMEIALAEARQLDLALPGLALAHELYLALRAQRGAAHGTQALILALASLSNVGWDSAQGARPSV